METTKYVTEKKSQKCFKNLETNGNGNITNQNYGPVQKQF